MTFAKIKTTQNAFLESNLRGTGRSLSAAQATALYGIQNIRARMTELRQAGLMVRTSKNTEGRTAYAVSARNVVGSRAYTFN
jgi:hypothetical protein